jgi:transcriptional regulator with XRE-family HTH domain
MKNHFPDNLKALRKQRRMSQTMLSIKSGIGQTSILRYEKGIHSPNVEGLLKLCKVFNCTPDYLVSTELKIKTNK